MGLLCAKIVDVRVLLSLHEEKITLYLLFVEQF